MSAVMIPITVNICAITHMEPTSVFAVMATNFKVMGSRAEVN